MAENKSAIIFRLSGLANVGKALSSIIDDFEDVVGRALYQEGEAIMTDSKENFVPVDLGTLKSSGHVDQPRRSGKDVTVLLAYGGAAAPYALIQHENPDFIHTVGSWKYLEKPLNVALSGMAQRVAAKLEMEMP